MVADFRNGTLEERKLKEIEHSDRRRSIVKAFEYKTDAQPDQPSEAAISDRNGYEVHFSNMKFYSISRSSFAYRDKLLLENIKGATALDYCCGNGEIAIEMALRGAKVATGIDISPVAVENATALAVQRGVSAICKFRVMDAENTAFEDSTFDIIHEYGALHHLELSAAFSELSRILKPEGKVVCTEALRHNPFIHRYRKRTPHLRTQWEVEHILGVPEILSGRRFFKGIKMRMFHLAVLGAVPLRKTRLFLPLLTLLEGMDNLILAIPFVRRLAWVAVIEYTRPRKR